MRRPPRPHRKIGAAVDPAQSQCRACPSSPKLPSHKSAAAPPGGPGQSFARLAVRGLGASGGGAAASHESPPCARGTSSAGLHSPLAAEHTHTANFAPIPRGTHPPAPLAAVVRACRPRTRRAGRSNPTQGGRAAGATPRARPPLPLRQRHGPCRSAHSARWQRCEASGPAGRRENRAPRSAAAPPGAGHRPWR